MEFLRDVLSNLLANAIFWLSLGLVAIFAISIAQYKFLRFFGLRTNRRLVVYLSNLWQPGLNNPQGCILSGHEFRVTKTIANLFGDTPFRLPEIVRGLVDSFWVGNNLQVEVRVSPLEPAEVEFTNLIVVGGTPKNYVRQHYLKQGLHYLAIDGERPEPIQDVFVKVLKPRLVICKGQRKGQKIQGEYNVAILDTFPKSKNLL